MSLNDDPRPALTPADVWLFIEEGCNVAEIAAYAGVSHEAASAMVSRATRLYARAEAA